jgi:mono/diheme cytochrome c family protein
VTQRHFGPRSTTRSVATAAALVVAALLAWPAAADQAQIDRGAYIFTAADCAGCHTDVKAKGPLLAGGRALKTPFGTFYSPNITPDPEHGIGRWSDADFIEALREGAAPDGSHLYPVFPYTSFTRMTDQDMLDLKAYIFSLPPVAQPNRDHEIDFPFGWRFTLGAWKLLNFTAGAFAPDPAKGPEWNRGAYLVEALGHCGECHTPRGWLGGLDGSRAFAGTTAGPDGGKVPNITPDKETGIGSWSRADILRVLKTGMLPDFDAVGSAMGEVVETTSRLSDADRQAIAVYLESLPPLANPEAKATKAD